MSGFYNKLAKTANRLIKSRGQVIYLLKDRVWPYDRDSGKARVQEFDYRTNGVFFPLITENAFGTMIEAGDIRLIMSAFDTNGDALRVPNEGDRIRDAAQNEYMIKEALPLNPDGTTVLYDCLIKGSGNDE